MEKIDLIVTRYYSMSLYCLILYFIDFDMYIHLALSSLVIFFFFFKY